MSRSSTRPLHVLLSALLLATPAFASDTAITIRDPAVFRSQMAEMGYAPDAGERSDNETSITYVLQLKSETLAAVLAGCKAGRDCTYLALVGSFSDVTAPDDWVAKMNADYDLIKVWKRDDGKVAYASGFPVQGVSRATFRAWIDGVVTSTDELAREAVTAGYGPKP